MACSRAKLHITLLLARINHAKLSTFFWGEGGIYHHKCVPAVEWCPCLFPVEDHSPWVVFAPKAPVTLIVLNEHRIIRNFLMPLVRLASTGKLGKLKILLQNINCCLGWFRWECGVQNLYVVWEQGFYSVCPAQQGKPLPVDKHKLDFANDLQSWWVWISWLCPRWGTDRLERNCLYPFYYCSSILEYRHNHQCSLSPSLHNEYTQQ